MEDSLRDETMFSGLLFDIDYLDKKAEYFGQIYQLDI
jgi:hypothetical protein